MESVSVLIVEDEAIVALEMQGNLESSGYSIVGRANSGKRAIELAGLKKPDVVLMDIRLKGEMDGIDAAYAIRNRFSIPVIFLTAYAEEEKLTRAKEALPFGYLLKPVHNRELNVTIKMALHNTRVEAERKKAEQALHVSNLFLDSIIDQNPSPMLILDMSGSLVRVNPASQNLLTFSAEDALGKYNIFQDDILQQSGLMDTVRAVFTHGLPARFELAYNRANRSHQAPAESSQLYLDVFIFAIRNPAGEISHVVVQHSDISEQKQMESERFRLAEEFKRTLQGLPSRVFRYRKDEQGEFRATFSEGRVANELAITSDSIMGKTLQEVVGTKMIAVHLPHFETVFNGGKACYDYEVQGKWYCTTLTPFERDEQGAVLEIVGFTEDITSKKQAEDAYRKSESRFHVLAELAPVGIYLTDKNGHYQYVNRRWCEMAGMTLEEALDDGWRKGLYSEDRPEIFKSWEAYVSNGLTWEHEYRFENRVGKLTWVIGLASRITDETDGIIGYIGVNLDINERKATEQFLLNAQKELEKEVEKRTCELKQAKEEAEVANEAKSEFLANISHELRNPMHQILSYSKYGMDKSDRPTEKLVHYFSQIRTSASKLMALLNDLLDLSKMESGRMVYERQENNVEMIISEVIEELNPSFKEKKLLVERANLTASHVILCDNYKIAQVMRNLLANSIKFSPEGGKISIVLSDTTLNHHRTIAPAMQISVFDWGIGIPDKELESIFDKFSQSSRTKTGAGGTGLGLAICKEIIDAHQGTIWAEKNLPAGSAFKFVLPLR